MILTFHCLQKCFPKCVCLKSGTCDKDMNLLILKIKKHMPNDMKLKVTEAAAKCESTVGKNKCETIYYKFKCFFGEMLKNTN